MGSGNYAETAKAVLQAGKDKMSAMTQDFNINDFFSKLSQSGGYGQ